MKVIGAGFGRTGTLSLRAALDIIDFGPCYHMVEVATNQSHAPIWAAAARGNPPDWSEFLAGYESTTDWPGCLFWRELSEHFGDAKVLLNTRDPERWYESVQNTFLTEYRGVLEGGDLSDLAPPERAPMFDMMQAVMGRQFGGFEKIADKDVALEVFRRHHEAVRATIPADRLLAYEVKQGWEPLCEFLDVPVPDEPFPHLNDRASFGRTINHYLLR